MATDRIHARRERRAAARREQILDAAVRVFAEKGFQRATTREIADAADVAEGTIYNYFENKDHLLVALLERLGDIDARKKVLEAALSSNLRDFFTVYFVERMKQIADNYPMLLATLPEILNTPHLREHYFRDFVEPSMAMLANHAQARIAQGEIRPIDVELTARLFVSLSLGMQVLLILGDPVLRAAWQQPESLAQALNALILDGLSTQKPPLSGDVPASSDLPATPPAQQE